LVGGEDMLVELRGKILGNDENLVDPGIERIGDRNID